MESFQKLGVAVEIRLIEPVYLRLPESMNGEVHRLSPAGQH